MSASQSVRIVVGADGSPSSIQALKWAFGQAVLTGGAIDAVCAWHYRGHGGFSEAVLGSVSQHVVHRAPCPVVIIRDKVE